VYRGGIELLEKNLTLNMKNPAKLIIIISLGFYYFLQNQVSFLQKLDARIIT